MEKSTSRRCRPWFLGMLTVAGLGLAPAFVEAQAAPVLDHFYCYVTAGPLLETPVLLKDQFSPAVAGVVEKAIVRGPVRFCNPVEKTTSAGVVTPISNPNNHLEMYLAGSSILHPTRRVVVKNQFVRRQRLLVTGPEVLAVPTQKNTEPRPEGLDHFRCYRAYGGSLGKVVTLKDQFHPTDPLTVTVLRPFGFCNPVEKTHDTVVTPIQNPDGHLVCYVVTPAVDFTGGVLAQNQFGATNLPLRNPDLLCVPSRKVSVTIVF